MSLSGKSNKIRVTWQSWKRGVINMGRRGAGIDSGLKSVWISRIRVQNRVFFFGNFKIIFFQKEIRTFSLITGNLSLKFGFSSKITIIISQELICGVDTHSDFLKNRPKMLFKT